MQPVINDAMFYTGRVLAIIGIAMCLLSLFILVIVGATWIFAWSTDAMQHVANGLPWPEGWNN